VEKQHFIHDIQQLGQVALAAEQFVRRNAAADKMDGKAEADILCWGFLPGRFVIYISLCKSERKWFSVEQKKSATGNLLFFDGAS